jgi:hypothetical protein
LHQHQLGLEYKSKWRWIEPTVMYLPGIGKERQTDTEFIENLDVGFIVHLGPRAFLQPYYSMIQTPTYRRNTFNVVLTCRF